MLKEYFFNAQVMGCDMDISIVMPTIMKDEARKIYAKILYDVQEYEKQFSRFLPESELSKVNKNSGTKTYITPHFTVIFQKAKELYTKTHSAFNPLLQVKKLGYINTFSDIQQKNIVDIIQKSSSNTYSYPIDFDSIILEQLENNWYITLQKNQQLDFGGFLKGYIAEEMAQKAIQYEGVTGVIINIGGDIFSMGYDENTEPFIMSIYNPVTKKDISQNAGIILHNKALATSGNYKRVWQVGSEKRHHIVNPKTCTNPATDLVSASVVHSSGAFADALATVVMTKTSTDAQTFLQDFDVSYVLITSGGEILQNNN